MTVSDVLKIAASLTRPLAKQILNLLGRAVTVRVDDRGGVQTIQIEIRKGEIREAERLQQFGFSSVPPEGSEAVTAAIGGRGDQVFVIATDHREHRPRNLESGESVLYNANGVTILLRIDGKTSFNEGETPVAKEGSATAGHTHAGGSLVALGWMPVTGVSASATDVIAEGEGSETVLVP